VLALDEKRMTQLDLLIARTQRNNTYLYALIFVLSISLLIFLPDPSEVAKTILIASSATLGTILIMQNQFWYGRPRGAGIPDPVTTTITTETPQPPAPQTTTVTLTPTGDPHETTTPIEPPAGPAADPDGLRGPRP
jgi:hypothetical protein